MPLKFAPVLQAFNAIGAAKENGEPYSAVRGVSVSGSGRHFRFWEDEINEGDVFEIFRSSRQGEKRWLDSPHGQTFYTALVSAKDNREPVYAAINRRGPQDKNGKSKVIACAPVLTADHRPAPGFITELNIDSGVVRIVFDLKAIAPQQEYVDQFIDISSEVRRSTAVTTSFSRNAEVRQTVLQRAKGVCEGCGEPGFQTDGGLYMETHHIEPLSENGPDSTRNVIALCVLCHKKAHLGIDRTLMRASHQAKVDAMN